MFKRARRVGLLSLCPSQGDKRALSRSGKMSALQTFLLVVDHDRQEAIRIAEKTAQGKLTHLMFLPFQCNPMRGKEKWKTTFFLGTSR